ncbi:ubiquitin thioesterase OTU1 [Caerostris extrusa]|uniref:Ubiquitin thioesterase OTU n=1 Tax=Caerostris extrusa TaxID=172846 RepID=A0AAV4W9P1_CAEEX|nr:ubiquitin thioesterase OTU1 [Caerostris extrusa]
MDFLNSSSYPPRALNIERNSMKLHELNITSGDTLIVRKRKEPENIPRQIQELNIEAARNSVDDIIRNQSGIMIRHVVPSDNSCLFASVRYILSFTGEIINNNQELRRIIAGVVENNLEKYNFAFLGKNNSAYCEWIQDPVHWGGAIELSIVSGRYKVEIVVIDTSSLITLRFGESEDYQNRIFLIYDGVHYDPLVMECEGHIQALFPANDPGPLEMAMEIAREAKASRQYTDIANFSVTCGICNVSLRGQDEMRAHAKLTGHNQFGEQ